MPITAATIITKIMAPIPTFRLNIVLNSRQGWGYDGDKRQMMEITVSETGEIHTASSLSGWSAAMGAAVLGGAIGFGMGPVITGGLGYFWTELLLPTFSLIYIYGVALCT